MKIALFGFEVASHGHDVLDDAFELGFGHWWGLVVHDGGVDVVGESEVEAHGVVVGGVVVIAGEVEAEFVDDFGAHADPFVEGFLGDVVLDPLAHAVFEWWAREFVAHVAGLRTAEITTPPKV